jgi:hypothetical protein
MDLREIGLEGGGGLIHLAQVSEQWWTFFLMQQ